MPSDRASPFTIPTPKMKFAEGPGAEPVEPFTVTVGKLIQELVEFADYYEGMTAQSARAAPYHATHLLGARDANSAFDQIRFRTIIGIDRLRAYIYSHFPGEELTIGTARRFLGDLIRTCRLSFSGAESLELVDALDRIEAAVCRTPNIAPTTPKPELLEMKPTGTEGGEAVKPIPVPDWINRHFSRKQFTLLKALFGKPEVTEDELCTALAYTNPATGAGNLDRRVSEVNKNLCERADNIGENWTIRERTRDGIKSYFLARQK